MTEQEIRNLVSCLTIEELEALNAYICTVKKVGESTVTETR